MKEYFIEENGRHIWRASEGRNFAHVRMGKKIFKHLTIEAYEAGDGHYGIRINGIDRGVQDIIIDSKGELEEYYANIADGLSEEEFDKLLERIDFKRQ